MRKAQPQITPGVARTGVHPLEFIDIVQAHSNRAGGRGRWFHGQEVNGAAHGIAAIQRRSRTLDHLDPTRAVHIGFVQRIVVKNAHGANRDPVFQVLIHRFGANGLANRHAVLLVAQIVPLHAGNAVNDFAHRFGFVLLPLAALDGANRYRGFREFGGAA